MSTAKLRALWNGGRTYDEIAEANERETHWRPTRSGVARKLDKLGFPPRQLRHGDLVPWRIKPEHNQDRLRFYLQWESAKRQGRELSPDQESGVKLLHDMLYGRGRLMVVGYHPDIGFYLAERCEDDDDIIRRPVTRNDPAVE